MRVCGARVRDSSISTIIAQSIVPTSSGFSVAAVLFQARPREGQIPLDRRGKVPSPRNPLFRYRRVKGVRLIYSVSHRVRALTLWCRGYD